MTRAELQAIVAIQEDIGFLNFKAMPTSDATFNDLFAATKTELAKLEGYLSDQIQASNAATPDDTPLPNPWGDQ